MVLRQCNSDQKLISYWKIHNIATVIVKKPNTYKLFVDENSISVIAILFIDIINDENVLLFFFRFVLFLVYGKRSSISLETVLTKYL